MTSNYILDLIPRRMRELGFSDRYDTQMRTLNIPPGISFTMKLYNVWIFLPMELLRSNAPDIQVESNFGYLDLNGNHGEQTFEHTGQVQIANPSTASAPASLSMIAVFPRLSNRPRIQIPIP